MQRQLIILLVLGVLAWPRVWATQIVDSVPLGANLGLTTPGITPGGRVYYQRFNNTADTSEIRIDGSIKAGTGGEILSIFGSPVVGESRFAFGAELTTINPFTDEPLSAYFTGENFFVEGRFIKGPDYLRSYVPRQINAAGDILVSRLSAGYFVLLPEQNDECSCNEYFCVATLGADLSNVSFVGNSRKITYERDDGMRYEAQTGVPAFGTTCVSEQMKGPALGFSNFQTLLRDEGSGELSLVRVDMDGNETVIASSDDFFAPSPNFEVSFVNQVGTVAFLARYYLDDGQTASAWFSSEGSSEPLIATGHVLNGEEITSLQFGGVDQNGVLAMKATLKATVPGNPDGTFREVILKADGGTEFPPDPDEEPPEVIFWNQTQGGSFFDSSNWDPDSVPDSDQVAVFDNADAQQIDFGSGGANTRQLRVEGGQVTFSGGSYQLNQGSLIQPSLLIQSIAGSFTPGLLIADHRLQTRHAAISRAGFDDLPFVFLVDDDAQWDNSGVLSVDGWLLLSTGSLVTDELVIGESVGSDGLVTIGSAECFACPLGELGRVDVGYAGEGTLEVTQFAAVQSSGRRYVGTLPGSNGQVVLDDGLWYGILFGDSTDLVVGDEGTGSLTMSNKSVVDASNLTLGRIAGSQGTLTINDSSSSITDSGEDNVTVEQLLEIGVAGSGTLTVNAEASIRAQFLLVGRQQGSVGRITLTDGSVITVSEDIFVGEGGFGELKLLDEAFLLPASLDNPADMSIGASTTGGIGELIIDNSVAQVGNLWAGSATADDPAEFLSFGFVSVVNGGALVANVVTIAEGSSLEVNGGTLQADSVLVPSAAKGTTPETLVRNRGRLYMGNSPGSAEIRGDLENSGELIIRISGTGAGQFDTVLISGDADLDQGLVRFVFDGYLPVTGDAFPFLTAGGSLSISGTRFEYQGANEGFEFDISTNAGGNITFTALNNAIDQLFGDGFE